MKKIIMFLVSIILLGIGLILHIQPAYDGLKTSSNNMTNHIFSPINSFSSYPLQSYALDEDAYIEEGMDHIALFSLSAFEFERALSSGFAFLIAGLVLLIITTRDNLEKFLKSVYNLFF